MTILAAMITAAMAATPSFASDWAPAAGPDALSAIEIPAAPLPATARAGREKNPADQAFPPREGENYSGAEELLIREFGITRISMDVPEAEVMRQDRFYNNAFCLEHALRLALMNLLGDYSNPSSPLARELAAMGVQNPSKQDIGKAGRNLLVKLNDRSSLLALVRPYKFNQPLNGETVEMNWIFFLRIEGRQYWSVVDRSGAKAAYAYGD